MKFSIITPTYKRSKLLERAVESVQKQLHSDWEMIIINDSPEDHSYDDFTDSVPDSRIRYYSNDTNRGVNYSRNRALDIAAKDSDWVIFLDDDDYLSPDALSDLQKLITSHPKEPWFVTNRAYADGTLVTKYPKPETQYSYIKDVLISKRCKGDVTHCIKANIISNIRYSKYIKQAEEWIFYYQIALHKQMYYSNINTTLTDGYDEAIGLNFRKRTRKDQLETLRAFVSEGYKLNILHHPSFLIYLGMRLLRVILK